MKKELIFKLTGNHPYPEYERFNFNDELVSVSSSPYDDGRWSWSSKLGCSQLYDTPEQAIRETCRRHGVTVLKLEKI